MPYENLTLLTMIRTTEQAANEYAANWEEKHNIHNPELYDLIVDAYKASAERMMSLPLAQRLTAEEKERVREMYKGELEFAQFYQRKANSCINQQCRMDYEASRDIAKSRADMLESIFGADLFKEGE